MRGVGRGTGTQSGTGRELGAAPVIAMATACCPAGGSISGWALSPQRQPPPLALSHLPSAWGGGTSASPALTLRAGRALPAVSASFHSPEWVPPVWGSWTRPGGRVPGQWPLEGPGGHMVTTGVGGVILQLQAVPAPSHPHLPDPRGSQADGEGPQLCLQPRLAPRSWARPGAGAAPGASEAPGLHTTLSGSGWAAAPAWVFRMLVFLLELLVSSSAPGSSRRWGILKELVS